MYLYICKSNETSIKVSIRVLIESQLAEDFSSVEDYLFYCLCFCLFQNMDLIWKSALVQLPKKVCRFSSFCHSFLPEQLSFWKFTCTIFMKLIWICGLLNNKCVFIVETFSIFSEAFFCTFSGSYKYLVTINFLE